MSDLRTASYIFQLMVCLLRVSVSKSRMIIVNEKRALQK